MAEDAKTNEGGEKNEETLSVSRAELEQLKADAARIAKFDSGAIIGDLNSKRGKVQGVEPQSGGNQKIIAMVPMAEMLTYANQLHSLTSGRGLYSMEFSHYEEVPAHVAQKIVAERQAQKQEKHA